MENWISGKASTEEELKAEREKLMTSSAHCYIVYGRKLKSSNIIPEWCPLEDDK